MQHVYTLKQELDAPLPPLRYIIMELDHCSVSMEVDTGVSLPETLYHKLWPRRGLKETSLFKGAHTCGGSAQAQVWAYEGQTGYLPQVVA